jgi:hypothetical protein
VPDRGVDLSDTLVSQDWTGDSPTQNFIKEITYDANQQTVDWVGDDNTGADGVFHLGKKNREYGKRFGARVLYSG